MEGDVLMVTDNGDDTYKVMNMGNMMDDPMVSKGSITIGEPIPLWSAVFW